MLHARIIWKQDTPTYKAMATVLLAKRVCERSFSHTVVLLCSSSKSGLKLIRHAYLYNLSLTGFISCVLTMNKNMFLNEVNCLCVHEKIISLVRANKKKDYCTTAWGEMNSTSGPNMATIATGHARLPFIQYVDNGIQITPSFWEWPTTNPRLKNTDQISLQIKFYWHVCAWYGCESKLY